jgi:hypothetical protein
MGTQSGLNVIRVAGKEFMLTEGGGEAIHLTREAARRKRAWRRPRITTWKIWKWHTTGPHLRTAMAGMTL